ncbi:FAS1 domain-containing protein [Lophiostoma macrostomum CBS 122681]|uniref:FAS1 domain-containing protein n=1 Tax=Lophiostoma macrostomum CBS 122681 TaxID=1314788 RepID=A0A6A6SM19_9PLEO|nr:FAS1 domain-containing protein [Lophiostoma macrostomum CBS 122681]
MLLFHAFVFAICVHATGQNCINSFLLLSSLESSTRHAQPAQGPLSGQQVLSPPTTSNPRESSIWDVISQTAAFSRVAALIDQHADDVRDILASTQNNLTVFLPTDDELDLISPGFHNMSSELLHETLLYHIIPWPLTLADLLCTPTLPTYLHPQDLNGPQRMKLDISVAGIKIDDDAIVRQEHMAASNGIIHAISSLLHPPAVAALDAVLDLPAADFSIFQHALRHTKLAEEVQAADFSGSTIFAPSNLAFSRLGQDRIGYLFSERGRDELKAIGMSHIVLNETLYSNAYYARDAKLYSAGQGGECAQLNVDRRQTSDLLHLCARGTRHFELETLRSWWILRVDVVRFTRWIEMVVDDVVLVGEKNLAARDGVVHVVPQLLFD